MATMNERAPAGLKRSSTMWKSVTSTFELRPDELRLLEDCCREMDLIDRLQKVIDKEGLTTTGSTGQVVIHPAVQEIRQHRNVLRLQLVNLSLPDEEEKQESVRSSSDKARVVAHARWQRKPA